MKILFIDLKHDYGVKARGINYHGPFIMQAYRDEEGVSIFKSQLDWVKRYL